VNVSVDEFFTNGGSSNEHNYYFMKDVEDLPADLQMDLLPSLFDKEFYPDTIEKLKIMEANIWIGVTDITTPVHYDLPHNFYVQLYGRKRFLLFPPDQWKYLYLFPRIHPSTRMSQVDWLDPENIAMFPLLTSLGPPYEVLLEPGDILYIPPYWGHHVSAVDFSISVSTHIRSTEVIIREEMNDSPFPFAENLDLPMKKIVLAQYLKKLFSSDNEMKKFIELVLKNRYELLSLDKYVQGLDEALQQGSKTYEAMGDDDLTPRLNQMINERSKRLKGVLSRYDGCNYGMELKNLELTNYVEDIVNIVVGPQQVVAFFKDLLRKV